MNTANSESSEKQTKAIRVMIVDDLEVVRLGLKLGLGSNSDIEIVGEANDGPTSVSKGMELVPDVILMDIGLPGFDGVVATKKLKASTSSRILVLSSHCDKQTVFTALQAGADGFCFKDASSEKVAIAIRTVASGGIWLSDGISESVLRSLKVADPEATNEHTSLSATELKILGFIFEGASIQSIAERLNYSSSEVMLYTNRVLQKVACNQSYQKGEKKDRRTAAEHEHCRTCPKCNEILPMADESCPFDGEITEVNDMIGTIFADRYEILSLLGSGTGGSVYKARHRFMQKVVAIKILHGGHMEDLDMLRRFRQEATTSSMLNHPNIVSVSDFGFTEDGEPFMIMDYIEGVSLADLLNDEGNLAPEEAIPIFLQICDALHAAHDQGIIHRDLKPGNVLVSGFRTSNMQVRLGDFGIAKLTKPLLEGQAVKTQHGEIFGSPSYMSPEQCMGVELDPLSDMYSMGCLMYCTLVGATPVLGRDAMEVMYKKMSDEVTPINETPIGRHVNPYLQAIVMKTLRFNKFDRFNSIGSLKSILADYLKIGASGFELTSKSLVSEHA